MTIKKLRTEIEQQAALMVAVATGGPPIKSVQGDYTTRRNKIRSELKRRGLEDPNPFRDLWAWYGSYSQHLGRWHERRTHISEMYEPLLEQLDALAEEDIGARLEEEPRTGWERVDDQIVQLRERYSVARTTEDFQAIGLLCRDIFVSLAEACYMPQQHGVEDEDNLREKLMRVVQVEAAGAVNKELRTLLKASIDYANKVQHDRGGTREHARVVAETTIMCVNLFRTLLVLPEDIGDPDLGESYDDLPF